MIAVSFSLYITDNSHLDFLAEWMEGRGVGVVIFLTVFVIIVLTSAILIISVEIWADISKYDSN